MNIDKHSILDEVHGLIGIPLFENEAWLSEPEAVDTQLHRLKKLGLAQEIKGDWGPTPLGKEFNLELIMVFLGLRDEHEIPEVLLKYKLIDEVAYKTLCDRLASGRDPERALRYSVQRAYFQLYTPCTLNDSDHPMVREE